MKIQRSEKKVSLKWFTKLTDTGKVMNFYTVAPLRHTRSVVSGLVHRIHRSCSNWYNFHEKAKLILDNNQYPKSFYKFIMAYTLSKIMQNVCEKVD